jgi:peroxiredoxin Q/BCP
MKPQSHRSRRALLTAAALGLLTLGGCSKPAQRPDGNYGLLPVGSVAPEVVGEDVSHNQVRLSALRGRPAVVYFYPKDGTPGCTKEACAFRDAWAKYTAAQVGVIGVSSNSAKEHHEFLVEKKLPFALAADESGSVAKAYGVGSGLFGYSRVTFLIDAKGTVAKVWDDVDPGVHADQVLSAASGLPAATAATP